MIKVSILNINVNNITFNGSLNIGKTMILKPAVNYGQEEVKEKKQLENKETDGL
ncbi:hypothetical protein [Alkalihalobacillus sp. BA299]|uniref:hypothetical protein n=1 Tax=Alkalihalobacillus sp. BA299 TaxID=2815938 RepID=UPI001ADBD0FB|nr:hypothetical protein [Alkalihalobacillus sp. BA299]